MTDKTKKIIAREGLVIIGFLIIVAILDIIAYESSTGFMRDENYLYKVNAPILFLYIIYASIRFIIWAVRTLRAK